MSEKKDITKDELQEALSSCEKELSTLEKKYSEEKVRFLKELSYLKEQLESQTGMLANALEYAEKIEQELNILKAKVDNSKSLKI